MGGADEGAGSPPPEVIQAAVAAFARLPLGVTDLAELAHDSDVDSPGPPCADRLLWFRGDGLRVELLIRASAAAGRTGGPRRDAGWRVTVRTVPPDGAQLRLIRDRGEAPVLRLSAGGRYVADGVRPGPVRLQIERAGRRPLVTSWVNVG